MAQHILVKDEWLYNLVISATRYGGSLKWNVEQEKNPLSRVDIHCLNKEEAAYLKVWYVTIWKPKNKIEKILKHNFMEYHFEVHAFPKKSINGNNKNSKNR